MMQLTDHFNTKEVMCKCGRCKEFKQKNNSIFKLEEARVIAGVAFKINSGYRCPNNPWYKESSSHDGNAYDIRAITGPLRLRIIYGLLNAGFERVGIGEDFIHADVDPDKIGSIWHYYKDYEKKDLKKEG